MFSFININTNHGVKMCPMPLNLVLYLVASVLGQWPVLHGESAPCLQAEEPWPSWYLQSRLQALAQSPGPAREILLLAPAHPLL